MKTFDGYKKRALTDEYALLAGGGHKPLSDFSTSAHTHSVKINGVTKTIAASGGAAIDLGNYKTPQTAVSDPTTSGTSISFIDTISLNTNGVITATKKTVPTIGGATASAAGTVGLVPAPAANLHTLFLKGDGTWATPSDTHWTTHLYIGAKDSASNAVTTNGNTYIKVTDNSTIRNQYIIKGAGRATVASDASGNITITSPTVTWSEISGKPSTFAPSAHNHPTSQINALTSYAKATAAAALATTDSLNTALGKLEYKLDVAYDLVTKANDSDGTIENLKEILDVLAGIKDTETIKAIIGKYLPLAGGTMTLGEGLKFHADYNYFGANLDARIISLLDGNGTTCDGGLIIDERATLNGTKYVTELLRIRHDEFKWKGLNILHAGNSNIKNGVITINGTSVTPLTSHQSLANYVTLNTALTISGIKTFSSQIKSSVATGTSPFFITSTTLVNNLNADLLDGNHSTSFHRYNAPKYIGSTEDYKRIVIALCETCGANTELDSYSSGELYRQRSNGLNPMYVAHVSFDSQYLGALAANYSMFSNFENTSSAVRSGEGYRACTFTYNGKTYAGIEFYYSQAAAFYWHGTGNFNVFAVVYYNLSSGAVLNSEINDSLAYNKCTRKEYYLKGNATSSDKWKTARTLTIGNTGKSVDGSTNVSWSLAEIGAASSGHTHTTSLAADTGTSSIALAYSGKYKLTAGGTSVIFTMPASDNTNTAHTTFAWTGGTTSGPTGTLSGNHTAVAFPAIPSASASASGIVTTGALTFAGSKTFNAVVHLLGSQTADSAGTGSLNLNNSDIYGVNSIKFADLSESAAEGLQWYRDSTHVDSIWVKSGVIYFTPNREWGKTGTNYTIAHSGNGSTYFTAFSGGGISSSGNTLTQANHSITVGGQTRTAGSSSCNIINSLSISKATSSATTNLTLGITVNGIVSSDKTISNLHATCLNNTSVSNPASASCTLNKQGVQWFSLINNKSGYAGDYGFPVSNNANGILYLGTHSNSTANAYYGGQVGVSSNGRLYYRFNGGSTWSTAANGGSWKTIAWTTDNVASASKWATARTITLTGSVTGSVSIDGSKDVTLATTTNHTHTFASLTSKPTTLSGYGITDALKIDGSNGTAAGVSTLINKLTTGTAAPTDADYYVCQAAGGGTTTTTYHRRPMSAMWSWIKAKTDALYPGKDGTGASGTWGISITGNAATSTNADKLDGYHANGLFTNFSISNSLLSTTIGGVTKTVDTVMSKRSGGYSSMNAVALLGNCVGMTELSGSDATVNPNAQTSWHHFINLSYDIQDKNMWQTQFAIKAGTTQVWVRSRAGGSIVDGTAWEAPWVQLARITDNVASATKLTSSAGSATLPIYFSGGKPVACTASSVFSNLSNSGNNISVTVAGQNRTLTVGYATNADKLDGYHFSDLENRYVNVTGDSMTGRLNIQTQTLTKSNPTYQQLVINGPAYDSNNTLTLQSWPGIGFHMPSISWASLIWNGYFTGVNDDFSGYVGFYGSGFFKDGSNDNYVLLGGGGHKLESSLFVSYASSAGSVAWANITGKPTTFNPASHTHTILTPERFDTNPPAPSNRSGLTFQFSYNLGTGASGWYNVLNMRSYTDPNYTSAQIITPADNPGKDTGYSGDMKWRQGRNSTWLNWRTILDSSNYSSYCASTSHTHLVKINGSTKTIAATGGTAVDLGTYLTAHLSVTNKAATLAWGTTSTIATIGSTDITLKMPSNPNTDTKNTAGSSNISSKIYLIGALSQSTSSVTYSHDTAYVDANGYLYSGGVKVLTSHQRLLSLTIQGNGSDIGIYTPNSAATTIDITPVSIGAAAESHTHSYLPLSGGTMDSNARIAHNGKLYIGNSGNTGWVMCQDLCSQVGTGRTRWELLLNGNFWVQNSIESGSITSKWAFINTGDATLKIYDGKTQDAVSDGNICLQTSIDSTDGQSHEYAVNYLSRCNLVLQPRGGQVYIGTNPNGGNTNYKLYVNGSIYSGGSMYAASYYETSDITLKTNFSKISTTVEQISNLPVFDFSWKENLSSRNTGTSAQAVQTILPNIVTESSGSLKLNYGVLGTVAGIIACKELVILKSEIEQLRERVIELEKQLNEYRGISLGN